MPKEKSFDEWNVLQFVYNTNLSKKYNKQCNLGHTINWH